MAGRFRGSQWVESAETFVDSTINETEDNHITRNLAMAYILLFCFLVKFLGWSSTSIISWNRKNHNQDFTETRYKDIPFLETQYMLEMEDCDATI